MIHAIDGSQPHETYKGWENFLSQQCEVASIVDGVTHYYYSNCNYIVFPDGTLIENFGFWGNNLMRRVARDGADIVLARLLEQRAELKELLAQLGG